MKKMPAWLRPSRGTENHEVLYHLATGGIAHFLGTLEGSIDYSLRLKKPLHVLTTHHAPLANLKFNEIFQAREVRHSDLTSDFEYPADFQNGLSLQPSPEGQGAYLFRGKTGEFPLGFLGRSGHSFCCDSRMCATHFTLGRQLPPHLRFRKIFKYLRISDAMKEKILRQPLPYTEPFIGVHFRNTDRTASMPETVNKLQAVGYALGNFNVYWSSDDPDSLNSVSRQLPQFHFSEIKKPEFHNKRNLHYGVDATHREWQLVSAFTDILNLARAETFLSSTGKTGWTPLITRLRDDAVWQNFFGTQQPIG